MNEESRARGCRQDRPLEPLRHLKMRRRRINERETGQVAQLTSEGLRALMPYMDLSSPSWLFMAPLTSGVSVSIGQRATILTRVLE